MRIFKRKADEGSPPELGDDICDLSPFDGSWETALAWLAKDRPQFRTLASNEDLIAFVNDGTLPRGYAGSNGYRHLPVDRAFAAENSLVAIAGSVDLRLMLAIAANLETSQRTRFSYLCGLASGFDLQGLLNLVFHAPHGSLSAGDLERAGQTLGWNSADLVAHLAQGLPYSYSLSMVNHVSGLSDFVAANAAEWSAALTEPKKGHERLWPVIGSVEPHALVLLAEAICQVATGAPKKVAAAAGAELRKLPVAVAVEHLKDIALSAKPAQRAKAVELMGDLTSGPERSEVVAWAREHLAKDRARSVREAVARLDEAPLQEQPKPELPAVDLPEIEGLSIEPGAKNQNLELVVDAVNGRSTGYRGWGTASMLVRLAKESPSTLEKINRFHVARTLLVAPRQLSYSAHGIATSPGLPLPSPLEISAVAEADALAESSVVQVVCSLHAASPQLWSSAERSDFVVFHTDAIVDLLETRLSSYEFDRGNLLALFEHVVDRPPRLEQALVAAVVGGYKSDREQLQRIVGPDRIDDVLTYLGSKKRAERMGAAEWIRHHALVAAAEPLRAAVRREKDDGTKAAMLGALEVLGEDLDEFLGADALLADAKKALAKKKAIPKSIDWLDLEALPPLAWADGSPVAREIVTWFIVMAVKAKSAEPSPILRRHFDNMRPELVRDFGSTILDVWMQEDLRTFTDEEAQELANQQAPHHLRWSQNGHGRFPGQSPQQIADALAAEARTQVAGSATTSKGLLAIAAASCGPEVADRVLAYIRKHRGHRVSQAKVLLEMLAWIDEPATVQAVMSVATRFRPKGIQAEAQRQAELLAERHGWTLDDLADRSVPDGGFDTDGRLVFDYGERTFTAHLNDDLTVRLVNDSTGKVVRSLPAGRADEDADHVKGIKSDFAAAKKELKSTAKIQPSRLHAAMCVGRTWSPDDFRRYFVDHPVMNRLATRLVWLSVIGDTTVSFRPLSDGTLIGVDDDDVDLDSTSLISLAHDQRVQPGLGERWQTHMSDYETAPLFGQFGRPSVSYAEGQTTITDFVGHGHNDGTLRGQMNRHAWQLGTPQDGGVAFEIVKDVPTAELTGVIEILGGLPAAAYDVGSWACFLGEMYFVPSGNHQVSDAMAVPFDTVPPVLLTEFYAEAQAIALAGSGFQPDYRQKY